jgi:hypothetical protein
MSIRFIVMSLLLVGSLAHADKPKAKKAPKPVLVGRVIGLEVYSDEGKDTSIVTVLLGNQNGVEKGWHARFREGTTTKPLAGGDAIIIRIDERSMVLKTQLLPAQVRANKIVELSP